MRKRALSPVFESLAWRYSVNGDGKWFKKDSRICLHKSSKRRNRNIPSESAALFMEAATNCPARNPNEEEAAEDSFKSIFKHDSFKSSHSEVAEDCTGSLGRGWSERTMKTWDSGNLQGTRSESRMTLPRESENINSLNSEFGQSLNISLPSGRGLCDRFPIDDQEDSRTRDRTDTRVPIPTSDSGPEEFAEISRTGAGRVVGPEYVGYEIFYGLLSRGKDLPRAKISGRWGIVSKPTELEPKPAPGALAFAPSLNKRKASAESQ